MAKEWFIRIAGKELGPISPRELKDYVKQGMIQRETPVRFGETGKWGIAGKVKGLLPASQTPEDADTPTSDSERLEQIAADVFSVAAPSPPPGLSLQR